MMCQGKKHGSETKAGTNVGIELRGDTKGGLGMPRGERTHDYHTSVSRENHLEV